jgi:hypothetical protein
VVVEDLTAEQIIQELCAALAVCGDAIDSALAADIYDHKLTQELLDARILVWESTNAR